MVSFYTDSPRLGVRNTHAPEKSQDRIGGTLWEYPERYLEHSAIMRADRIKTPLLNITGDQDPNVPASQSREIYYALRRLGTRRRVGALRQRRSPAAEQRERVHRLREPHSGLVRQVSEEADVRDRRPPSKRACPLSPAFGFCRHSANSARVRPEWGRPLYNRRRVGRFGLDSSRRFARYSRDDFLHDLIAGITVGLVALPLAMAFGIASGVDPAGGHLYRHRRGLHRVRPGRLEDPDRRPDRRLRRRRGGDHRAARHSPASSSSR